MNKLMKSALVALLAGAGLTACGSSAADSAAGGDCTPAHEGLKTVQPGTLTVATYNFAPFVTLEGVKAGGVEGDIITAIGEMECLDVVAQPLDTGSVIASTQSGRTDIAAGNWYCTAERSKVLELGGPVYGDLVGLITPDGASTFEELKGKQLGSVDGYNWNEEFEALYGSDVKLYPNPTAMYNDLKSGRIEVAVDSFGSATFANEQHGGQWEVTVPEPDERVAASLEPAQVCFPMSKDNAKLFEAVNDDLEKLREDGTIAEILEKNGLDSSAAETGELRLIG